MICREVLDIPLSQTSMRLSPSDAFAKVYEAKSVLNSGFIASIAAFVKQIAISTIEVELNKEPKVVK